MLPTSDVSAERPRLWSFDRIAAVGTAAEWALAAVLVLTVALYAYLGRYTRYAADDFTLSNNLHARGFWAEQVWEYLHWTGRFAYIALMDVALLLGEAFTLLLPGLIVVTWVVAIAAAVKMVIPTVSRVACLGLAAGIVFTTLHLTPSPFLSLYWSAGSLEYTVPLLLGTVLVALLASRREAGRLRIIAAGVIAFVAGGFNEAYAFCQLAGLCVPVACRDCHTVASVETIEICAGLERCRLGSLCGRSRGGSWELCPVRRHHRHRRQASIATTIARAHHWVCLAVLQPSLRGALGRAARGGRTCCAHCCANGAPFPDQSETRTAPGAVRRRRSSGGNRRIVRPNGLRRNPHSTNLRSNRSRVCRSRRCHRRGLGVWSLRAIFVCAHR